MAFADRHFKIIAAADLTGSILKDTLVAQLRALNIDVEDLGTYNYYLVGEEVGRHVSQAIVATSDPSIEIRGLIACGTGVGVAIFANKFRGVYAATCLTLDEAMNARSINNCNVLAVSGMYTPPDVASQILDTFLNTPFKPPCPSSGSNPSSSDIQSFLDNSLLEMLKIETSQIQQSQTLEKEMENLNPFMVCSLVKNREFSPVEIVSGGLMTIVRETPTSAFVKFKAGSVEPAHHHTFGHDLVVLQGSKQVWNLNKGEKYDLGVGDYLFTPAGDVHRVKYFEDTELFIKWEGNWDIILDEDLAAANAAIAKENKN